jgi:very-short-patch-repair endonuclease
MKPAGPLHHRARQLRRRCTDAERLLWTHLRHNQIEGVKFRQQEPVEKYIVDFLSYHPKLVVELDGSQHQEQQIYDHKRDDCLRRNGFVVLRFWDNEVFENLVGVLEVIREQCLRLNSLRGPLP